MDCPNCGHANATEAHFCGSCAAPLSGSAPCPACAAQNPVGQRFCNDCGHALSAAEPPEHLAEKIRAVGDALDGERKQVTVLFADVMGSMELAEQCDPEVWRRIMGRLFATLCEGVHRFEGTVDKFTGDGMMALFGAPIAHEDHARRACYAALHLQAELATYAAELRRTDGLNLSIRMGLNSGEVVVGTIGEDLEMDFTAIGHTVGLAQRMEQLAAADRVYVTEYTATLVEGYLELTDLGEFQVKGSTKPLRVHELMGVGQAHGRLDVSRARGFSRFVGRSDELQVLETAREQALAGHAQVVGIVGEAGLGKSRLCHEFAERYRAMGIPIRHVAGEAHTKSVPFMPILQLMRSYFDITELDDGQTARERIAGKLLLLDESFAEDLALLFDFLAVADPERPAERMDPEARQRRLVAVVKRLIRAEGARQPGINLYEDLHWFDPATEAFMAETIEALQGTNSLTIVNFRPEYRAPWMATSYYRQIALAPLGAEAVEELLSGLLGSHPSLDGLSEPVLSRTQGNPFFIEELVRSFVETGSLEGEPGFYRLVQAVDEEAIPASVQIILAARIDRLGEREKALLQAAAVIGKEFSAPVLQKVVGCTPDEADEGLRHLVAGEFVFQQELYPEALYAFKHPLTQEVAYGWQLGERRAIVHAAVARALADQYPERLDERAALLAQHWEAAGEGLEAARWHARAAEWSGYNDPTQALPHWTKVRELADGLPESAESAKLGLTARISLLNFGWRLGISRPEAEAMFHEAEAMAVEAGDMPSRAFILSMWGAILGAGGGDLREYARLAARALELAGESGDPVLPVAMVATSYAYWLTGQYAENMAAVDRAIALADGDPTVGAGMPLGCPYAWALGWKGYLNADLGDLDEARRLIEQGRKVAGDHGDIEVAGWTHMWSTMRAFYAGEAESALPHAQQALEIAERMGGSFSRAHAWTWLGVAERMRGEWQRSIDAIERGSELAREGRTAVEAEPWRLALLAESYLGLGDPQRALALVQQAVTLGDEQGQEQARPHIQLALARVLLGSPGPLPVQEVEAALARTLEAARAKNAKIFEPFVHAERAELAHQTGDDEGHQRELGEAYRLFVECGASGHAERLERELALPTS
jgi:class 3 adenylate cyclase/tetratricopeptide (TPR) repeat protein